MPDTHLKTKVTCACVWHTFSHETVSVETVNQVVLCSHQPQPLRGSMLVPLADYMAASIGGTRMLLMQKQHNTAITFQSSLLGAKKSTRRSAAQAEPKE